MIAFDLSCSAGHQFEGWFASSTDFDAQRAQGLVNCPVCNDGMVDKALSVPNIGRKGNQAVRSQSQSPLPETPTGGEVTNNPVLPPVMIEMMQKLANAQTELLKDSQWVGREFAETARAIHYGEEGDRQIHGETSLGEAQALAEEGVSIAPLPFPVIPPESKN
jgi:hypothetical protein